MEWAIFLILASICFFGSIVFAVVRGKGKYRSGRFWEPTRILFAGVVASSILMFIPIYVNIFGRNDGYVPEAVLLSVHNMIRLFVVDGEFDFVTSNLPEVQTLTVRLYTALFSVLFVLAPILTFGFVLSFFKNTVAYKRYITHYCSDVFVFSELNERSLALAADLYRNKPKKRFFVFTDVFERDEEQTSEQIERAKELGAICFRKDIAAIDFSFHSAKSQLNFFTIGENQTENTEQALMLIKRWGSRKNTNLYVFSSQVEAEFLLAASCAGAKSDSDGKQTINMKVRHVDEVQSLISRTLYETGYDKIFASAYLDASGTKRICAVVLGMGHHGAAMFKALTWFCQMTGYEVEIHAFDRDMLAEEKLRSQCPELLDFSGKTDIEGEAKYTVKIHAGVDTDTEAFDKSVMSLPRITYVWIALGDDERNIAAAVKMRMLSGRCGYDPEIQAIVYDSAKKEALRDITNYKGQKFNIDYMGDMKTCFSESVILNSEVEEAALRRHLKWGKESDFWLYGYNYRSSIASAVHRKMKILCGIPGADKPPEERSDAERIPLRILEHCRWNAYMRSEGYIYAGTTAESGRDDLVKKHHCLVPYWDLPPKEQEKDDD